MVAIDPRILSKAVKAVTPKEEKVEEAQIRGTIVYHNQEHFVQLDGAPSNALTPIANFAEGASDAGFVHGDRVLVLIKNHQAIVTKNLTTGLQAQAAKEASTFTTAITDEGITAQRIIANDTFTNTLRANNITADEIIAGMATIDTLDANYAHITNGVIDNAKIGVADVNDLSANYAHITTGVIDNAKIDAADVNNLSANYAHITNGVIDNAKIGYADVNGLNANYAHITNGVIDNAKIGYADVDDLNAHYASINLANVNNAWIQNGVVKDAAISDAQIIGVSANKLTAGTIDASNITVTNLNASNITTGSITVDGITIDVENNEASIDGGYIEDGTITMNGLAQSVQNAIDGAIETYTGSVVPTLNNAPASSWTTTKLKDSHIGDIYYVINAGHEADGYCYRFAKSGSTYSWVLIQDSDVTAALSRLTTAEGKIEGLETFESETSSWMTDTDEELSSVKSNVTSLSGRMDTAEGNIQQKVDTSTFNTLSQTVGENSSNITTLTTITENNGLTTSTNITNTVNNVSQTASGNSSKISQLTTTLGTNADGTTKAGDIVHQVSELDQDLDSITTRVGKTEVRLNGQFATSSTGSSTTAKTATITPTLTGYTLEKGAIITVKFTNANTNSAPTLNVNSTGAKAIRTYSGGTLSEAEYKWPAGATMSFVYDGTYWRIQDSTELTRLSTAETNITQNAAQIQLKASQSSVDSLSGRVDTAETSITQTATSIESLASNQSTYTKPDGTTGTNAMASAISQNAGNIALKANATDVYSKTAANALLEVKANKDTLTSEINASADTVLIRADRVNIQGVITAINDDTTTTIDGGKITTNSIGANQLAANAIDTSKLTVGARADMLNSNVQVGGRNLFGYGSDCSNLGGFNISGLWTVEKEDGYLCAHAAGALTTTKYLQSKIPFTPKPLETMTFSLNVKIKNIVYGTTNPMCELYFSGQTIDGTWRAWSVLAVYIDGVKYEGAISNIRFTTYISDTEWHHFAVVARAVDANFTGNMAPFVYFRDATGDLYVRNIKYERGNKYTDWTPAPEDTPSEVGENLCRGTSSMGVGAYRYIRGHWRASGGTATNVRFTVQPPVDGVTQLIRITNTGSSAAQIGLCQDSIPNLKQDGIYTLSAWVRLSTEGYVYCRPIYYDTNNLTPASPSIKVGTSWQYISYTGKLTGSQAHSHSGAYFYFLNAPANAYMDICGVKLEEGVVPTAWTQATNDSGYLRGVAYADFAKESNITLVTSTVAADITYTGSDTTTHYGAYINIPCEPNQSYAISFYHGAPTKTWYVGIGTDDSSVSAWNGFTGYIALSTSAGRPCFKVTTLPNSTYIRLYISTLTAGASIKGISEITLVSSEIGSASKTATNYIYADSSGIRIASANPSTQNQRLQLTSSRASFYSSDNVERVAIDSSTGVVIGLATKGHTTVNDTGLYVYDANNALALSATSGGVNLYKSGTNVASFSADTIELGKNKDTANILMCNGKGQITYTSTLGMIFRPNVASTATLIQDGSKDSQISLGTGQIELWAQENSKTAQVLIGGQGYGSNSNVEISADYLQYTGTSGVASTLWLLDTVPPQGSQTYNAVWHNSSASNYGLYRPSSSSMRYKEDIKPVEDDRLDPHRLYDIEVVQFKFKEGTFEQDDPYEQNRVDVIGFIAEDVLEHYPQAAIMLHDEAENWDERYIIPPMLKLIQEQNDRITELERRLS